MTLSTGRFAAKAQKQKVLQGRRPCSLQAYEVAEDDRQDGSEDSREKMVMMDEEKEMKVNGCRDACHCVTKH